MLKKELRSDTTAAEMIERGGGDPGGPENARGTRTENTEKRNDRCNGRKSRNATKR